ncbi:nitroreductase family protein [Corynebacterium flavescens]|uniref:nitroreductase family protein n=1 Tax=Corynebacterium flavescens TaxID=28028 RepID=UPI00264842A7|nr:nitroreductase family protein [Corynebacterium flavescens]MDN6199983.1 nitroreductase family protein [Corynebacterium flavescens]MDN6227515.1 nitroreductase family protein [Corynebacterium flavescens]MDN6476299.1 nitroreductase family protein [Corynebacterium flavescens]MDN6532558.1 nitroreductase family protein [Corynebacterium flavescens]MDN6646820.1 nitroreductase family protein [Corynebacterium flavescens]
MSLSVIEAIESRRSTRKYTDEIPNDELIDRVVKLALEAPSAFNAQQREIVVVTDPDVKQALFDASHQRQFLDAPAVFVAVARAENDPSDLDEILGSERAARVEGFLHGRDLQAAREASLKDASLAAAFLLLAAQSEGLGTSPTTGWDEEKVKQALGIGGRADRAIALIIAAGFPAEHPQHPGRLDNRRIDNSY